MHRLPVRIVLESLVVALGAIAFALVANAVSPRGLPLTEPKGPPVEVATARDLLRLEAAYHGDQLVLVDAQGPFAYRQGHLPKALRFDLGRPDETMETVTQACENAIAVVVYCKSADCANSDVAASLLRQAHLPPDGRLYVYRGGLRDWTGSGHAIAEGEKP